MHPDFSPLCRPANIVMCQVHPLPQKKEIPNDFNFPLGHMDVCSCSWILKFNCHSLMLIQRPNKQHPAQTCIVVGSSFASFTCSHPLRTRQLLQPMPTHPRLKQAAMVFHKYVIVSLCSDLNLPKIVGYYYQPEHGFSCSLPIETHEDMEKV